MRGWPIAFWVLDQWLQTLVAVRAVRSRTLLRMVARLVRFIYTRCDLMLSPSKRLMSRIAEYSGAADRIAYFPNWVESAYESGEAATAEEIPTRDGAFSVIFGGNIGEAQDFPAILDAAEHLAERRDIRWLIVGDGRMTEWVRGEIGRRGLGDRVQMLGRQAPDRMPSFFRHADALLVSLRADPIFAMTALGKIQSYLAVGLPVIAMLDGEGADVIDEARAGVTCAAGDAEGLANGVRTVAAMSSEQRAEVGRRGAEYARMEYSRERLFGRLEGHFSDIAHMSRGRLT